MKTTHSTYSYHVLHYISSVSEITRNVLYSKPRETACTETLALLFSQDTLMNTSLMVTDRGFN
jgi:hypothetical protein